MLSDLEKSVKRTNFTVLGKKSGKGYKNSGEKNEHVLTANTALIEQLMLTH